MALKTSQPLVITLVEMPKVVADNWPLDVVLKDFEYLDFQLQAVFTTICARFELIPLLAVTIECLIIATYIKCCPKIDMLLYTI